MKVYKRKTIGVPNSGIRYQLAADHIERERAERLSDTLLDNIVHAIKHHPRSLQKRIGPSEMGVECKRSILHKLNGDPEPPRMDVPWKPTIGTGVHSWLEDTYNTINTNIEHPQYGRWIPELSVMVGSVGGTEIWGSVDLFDTWTGTVIDWKIVGKYTLQQYRSNGPSQQYRGQAHLYGQGYANAGQDVKMVMIVFLPREGDFTDTFIWSEPWNPPLAASILDTVDGLSNLLALVGIDKAISMFPECDDRWCKWCGSGSSFGKKPIPATTADLFGKPTPTAPEGMSTASLFQQLAK